MTFMRYHNLRPPLVSLWVMDTEGPMWPLVSSGAMP